MTKDGGSGGPRSMRWLDARAHRADGIMARLVDAAADVVPDLPRDERLMDPMARLLMRSIAREYERLYGVLDGTVEVAYRRMVAQLLSFPSAPRPASTVLEVTTADPDTEIDEDLRVLGTKVVRTDAGQEQRRLMFAPMSRSVLSGIPRPTVVVESPDGRMLCTSSPEVMASASGVNAVAWDGRPSGRHRVHFGIDALEASAVDPLRVFVSAPDDLRDLVVWTPWRHGETGQGFVPASTRERGSWFESDEGELFRSRSDRGEPISPYHRSFVELSRDRIESARSSVPEAVSLGRDMGMLGPATASMAWFSLDVSEVGDPNAMRSLALYANCVVAWNVRQASFHFRGGIEPEQSVELDVGYDRIVRLLSVYDRANQTAFAPAGTGEGLRATDRYHLDTADSGNAILWLSSAAPAPRRRDLDVDYLATDALDADGIAAGSIKTLYEQHRAPGVVSVVNVAPSLGAEPMPDTPTHSEELRAALVTRGRVVTAHDFHLQAKAFAPRLIDEVEVGRGVARTPNGWTPSVEVRVRLHRGSLVSAIARDEFVSSLQDHLQSRAAVGTTVGVVLVGAEGAVETRT